ncbi:phosphatidylserine decarboxylase proenzyme, mitochondrial isoform X1 [Chironomus tepperi]|uniref:phosphatidylserine decarboxylase proenzyme, mitochondrial isoform X1 n=1 Tax=Chironomus tepperi TaxID=113505 RepID=UPI00391F5068
MAVYFIPKTKLISRATNFRPKQWTSKWTIAKRPFSQSHQQYHQHSTNKSQTGTNKGKLHKIKRKWRWGATGWTILSILDWWLLAAGGWLSWQGVILRWTPLGLCIVAAAQWHLHNKECERKGLPRTAPAWQTNAYCLLPLRMMSRGWGWLAERQVPETFRPTIFGLYSTAFGVNLEEAVVSDLKHYRSLSDFFTRSIKEECRTIAPDCIVSPCDGRVLHFGPVSSHTHLEQVKGVTYSLETFLGPNWKDNNTNTPYIEGIKEKTEGTQLYHCIIYLAPGDYHRFHSPTSWKPSFRRHFHGELLSVSPKVAKLVPGLFCINERASYIGEWEHGFFSFTAVGATNVGSVQVFIDEDLKTNKWRGLKVGTMRETEYDEAKLRNDVFLNKGELVGQFNMGSTIVLVFEAPKSFRFNLASNQVVKVGQSLGCFCDNDNDSGVESETL